MAIEEGFGSDPRQGARVASGVEEVSNTVNKANSNDTMNSDLFKELFGDSASLFKTTTKHVDKHAVTVTDIKTVVPSNNDGRSEKEPDQGSHTLGNQ